MEELIKKDKKIKLLLPGEDEVNGYYHNMVKERKLSKYIKLLGYREDIPKLLRISDLSVSSSLREGLPVHIMEAYITGLPVIALKCRGVSDMLSLENGFMVNTEDEFIEKVEYLKNNPHLRKIISKNNKEKAKQYYIEKILKDYKKIYKLK
jgi:glycosyltransferase EpsD